ATRARWSASARAGACARCSTATATSRTSCACPRAPCSWPRPRRRWATSWPTTRARSSSATTSRSSPTPTPSASSARPSACRAIPRHRRRRLLLYRRDEVLVGRATPPRLQILTVVQRHARARALGLAELLHERVVVGVVVDTELPHLDVLPL